MANGQQDTSVPMIDSDNNPVMVPSSHVSDRVAGGYKRGMFMTDTEGNTVVVPHEKLGNALRNNYKVGPSSQQPIDDTQDGQKGLVSRSLSALGRVATLPYDITRSIYHAAADPVTQQEAQQKTALTPEEDRSFVSKLLDKDRSSEKAARENIRKQIKEKGTYTGVMLDRLLMNPAKAAQDKAREAAAQGRTSEALGYSIAAGLPGAGPWAASKGEQAAGGDVAGALIETAGTLLAPKAVGKVAGKLIGEAPPVDTSTAVDRLRQGVNPTVADAGYRTGAKPGKGFMGEAEAHIDKIVNKGHETGLPQKLANSKTPGEALNHTAETVRATAQADPYYKTRIEPYLDENFGNVKGYRGDTIGEGQNATLRQMNARLTTINNTLQSAYVKGGAGSVASQAAIGAEAKASLTAEAEAIRNQISSELSKRTGTDANVLKAERQNYGQMNDLADTIQYHANDAIHSENVAKNTPLTIGDLINPKGKIGQARLGALVGKSHPQVQALRDVFERYNPKLNVSPPTGEAPQPARTRQQPAWMNQPVAPASTPEHISAATGGATPAIPATEPGLLRPGAGTAPSSTPLPFGPDPALMRRPVRPTVGQENPEISPLSLGSKQEQSLVGSAANTATEGGFWNAAKLKLGPKATVSEIATEAQRMKDVATPTRTLPSDFRISTDETVNGTDLTMKDIKGKKMGTIGIRDSEPIYGRPASEVGDINLSKEHQGKGYGQALYERAAKHAANNGDNYLVSSGSPTKAATEAWQRLKAAHPNEIRYTNGRWQWNLSKFK